MEHCNLGAHFVQCSLVSRGRQDKQGENIEDNSALMSVRYTEYGECKVQDRGKDLVISSEQW